MGERTMQAAYTLAKLMDFKVSNLKLQKLLYFAHMLYLGETGKPLVDGQFGAWDLGPVEPDVYHLLKAYGAGNIRDVFPGRPFEEDSREYKIIDDVAKTLGKRDPWQLVELTHEPNGAWIKNYKPGVYGITIPNADILAEYKQREERAAESRRKTTETGNE